MCNEFARRISLDQLRAGWVAADTKLLFPEALPNMPALDSIRITDPAIIIRAAQREEGAEVITRRWSWPQANGKPVYNFRSDGREFTNGVTSGRCLIPADGFYEFTTPPPAREGEAPTKKPAKSKWELRLRGFDWFCIAGLWRTDPNVGEAWTMLTTAPGPDIAPFHDRQVVLLTPADYARWLDGSAPAAELCRPLSAGTLDVRQVR
ncbi:SOS response-associated peptidase family protein [Sphingomonas crusticola]|uniref:SOS response-associated peptidase family protein n=1 Tax=Sphingomonas crusticola TaxID=1697973 RepID=UPI000E230CC2|nr:SOS response-associated peptidase [Sphingomonas crusticola]